MVTKDIPLAGRSPLLMSNDVGAAPEQPASLHMVPSSGCTLTQPGGVTMTDRIFSPVLSCNVTPCESARTSVTRLMAQDGAIWAVSMVFKARISGISIQFPFYTASIQ
jgi:hypothetical protein